MYIINNFVAFIPSHLIRLVCYQIVIRAQIGEGSSIFMGAWFETMRNIKIGKNSTINQKCRLDNRGLITIGNNVSVSPEVCILTADHDMQSQDFRGRVRAVNIEDYVFIGTRALILPGVRLGKGAVVAAGSVVTKDVADFTIVAGNPAKPIGRRQEILTYESRYRRLFR